MVSNASLLVNYQIPVEGILSKEINDGEPSDRKACRFSLRVVLSQDSVRIQSFMLEVVFSPVTAGLGIMLGHVAQGCIQPGLKTSKDENCLTALCTCSNA